MILKGKLSIAMFSAGHTFAGCNKGMRVGSDKVTWKIRKTNNIFMYSN